MRKARDSPPVKPPKSNQSNHNLYPRSLVIGPMKCRKCRQIPNYFKKVTVVLSEADESDNSAMNFILCDKCFAEFLEQLKWIYGPLDLGT